MKRKGGSSSGSAKRQRQSDMIQPGEYGVYVTCPRRKEPQAGKEMKMILADAIEKYYPKEEEEEEVKEEEEGAKGDIEDEIAKEVADMKALSKSKNQRFRQIQLNAESLLFFKVKSPIVPSVLVERICSDLLESGEKKGRFIQRLVGVDSSCSPTLELWMDLLKSKIGQYLGDERGGKYLVNLTRRHFETFDREQIEEHVAQVMKGYEFEHRYKDVDIVVNVYCFKNNMGVSLMRAGEFQRLAKCNLQMIFDLATGSETALGRHKAGNPQEA